MKQSLLVISILLLSAGQLYAQLAGEYSIGSGQVYPNVNAAVNDMFAQGISGDVTFTFKDPVVDEQVTIPAIPGASAANEILFDGQNNVTWGFAGSGPGANWIVNLDGADWVTFANIAFGATDTDGTHGRLIVFQNGAENNRIADCDLTGLLASSSNEGSLIHEIGPTANRYNTFTGNTFANGYIAVDFWGATGNPWSQGINISSNSFSGQFAGAIQYLGTNGVIANNTSTNLGFGLSSYIGIKVNGLGSNVVRNKVDLSTGAVGIWYQWNGGAARTLIANNMVSVHTGQGVAGIRLTTGGVDVVHNTVRVSNVGGNTAALLSDGGGNPSRFSLKNNLFIHEGGAYAMDIVDTADIDASDYNNFYTSGAVLIRYGGIFHTLASYQVTAAQDANSISKVIAFANIGSIPQDLHLSTPNNFDIDLIGEPLAGVTTDFDGTARDAYNPYMGADEAISLAPLDNADAGGSYTVAGGGADFLSPNQAIDHLNARGIKGSTTFDVTSGSYAVHRIVEDFPRYGAAASKTTAIAPVRFQKNGVTNPQFQHAATSAANNWVIKLDGADGVSFNEISFQSTGSGSFGRLIVLDSGADDITIDDCTFLGRSGASSSDASELVFSSGSRNDGSQFLRSTFLDGTDAIRLVSQNTDFSIGTRIESNVFQTQSVASTAVFLQYHSDVVLHHNTITYTTNTAGLDLRSMNGLQVTENRITTGSGTVSTGMSISIPSTTTLIANNAVRTGQNGLSVSGGSGVLNVFNNTLLATSNTYDGKAMRIGNGGSETFVADLRNNILIHDDAGIALDVPDGSLISTSDHNLFYSDGAAVPIMWDGVLHTLQSHQLTDGRDASSLSKDLTFANRASGDLHLAGASDGDLDLIGVPLVGVEDDVDGLPRDPYNPYIGADEASNIGPLAGAYRILGSGADFLGVGEAIVHLNARGIQDQVTFEVSDNIYLVHEIIEDFPRYGGASKTTVAAVVQFETFPVSFTATWRHAATGAGDNWAIKLDGADYVRFDNIEFEATGTGDFGRLLVLENGADNNSVNDCVFTGLVGPGATVTDEAASIYAGGTVNSTFGILNSAFAGGSWAVWLEGLDAGNLAVGNIVQGNTFDSQTDGATFMRFQSDPVWSENIVTSTLGGNGIELEYPTGFTVQGNEIRLIGTGTQATAIQISDATTSVAASGLVANNMILAASRGIDLAQSDFVQVLFNTIRMRANPAGGGALVTPLAATAEIRNNILIHDDGGLALNITQDNGGDLDFNDLFNGGTVPLVKAVATSYADLAAYQNATGHGSNSVAKDVTFVSESTGNLRLTGASIGDVDLAGTPVVVLTDIDGETRSPVAPYMGADEASALPFQRLDVQAFLSGPFDTGTSLMLTGLNAGGVLDAAALINPYASAPFSCGGSETVPAGFFASHPDIVDWICVELRTGAPAITVVEKQVAFLLNNGSMVSTADGVSPVRSSVSPGLYSIVIRHRNHLAIMSSNPVDGSSGVLSYDFRSLGSFGTGSQQDLPGGLFAMRGGDADKDGNVFPSDLINYWIVQSGSNGYREADFDLDGNVFPSDLINHWIPNTGKGTQVPAPVP